MQSTEPEIARQMTLIEFKIFSKIKVNSYKFLFFFNYKRQENY